MITRLEPRDIGHSQVFINGELCKFYSSLLLLILKNESKTGQSFAVAISQNAQAASRLVEKRFFTYAFLAPAETFSVKLGMYLRASSMN